MNARLLPVLVCAAMLVAGRSAVVARAAAASRSAEDAIRSAVIERLGTGVEVAIVTTGIAGSAPVFRDARPDPSASLGKPVRFTLVTEDGAAVPVSVVMTVTGERAVARRAVTRGEKLAAADMENVRGPIVGVPLRRLPRAAELVGGKARRPIAAGTTLLAALVSARRAVEPGDQVVATAAGGAVEVTAEFTAADGGAVGDVIRIVNPATRRYVRGRIVKEGFVEVVNGR